MEWWWPSFLRPSFIGAALLGLCAILARLRGTGLLHESGAVRRFRCWSAVVGPACSSTRARSPPSAALRPPPATTRPASNAAVLRPGCPRVGGEGRLNQGRGRSGDASRSPIQTCLSQSRFGCSVHVLSCSVRALRRRSAPWSRCTTDTCLCLVREAWLHSGSVVASHDVSTFRYIHHDGSHHLINSSLGGHAVMHAHEHDRPPRSLPAAPATHRGEIGSPAAAWLRLPRTLLAAQQTVAWRPEERRAVASI